ncbi:cysteine-rich receptor-like protein kinase 8 [Gastrolobium bilobum]|uniref:cysteine-rich receptor-like protein kinase 8 n=1 Tax=Gastrolobium bilobum TaxID=150636 RepID=UPI002AB2762A|nr:cysteine-rich receptor-like protein kinase 8 [Gastrolobium bilobum]
MASNKILFSIILIIFLFLATTESQGDPFYLYQDCSSLKTNPNTSFQLDLKSLLSTLPSRAIGDTQFFNTTFTGKTPSDSIYAMFMCRGDISSSSNLCQQCVLSATHRLSSDCSLSKQAVIWFEECMVRYSTTYFFSSVSTTPKFPMWNTANVSNPKSFMSLLFMTMNETADEAALHPIGHKNYATKEVSISEFQTLYFLAQCTPDLSPHDCRTCLGVIMEDIRGCCGGSLGGRVLCSSCNIRYELYPFYHTSPTSTSPELVPATKTSDADSRFSDNPVYLSHNCSSNKTFTSNSTFQIHLKTLLSYLSSNATTGKKVFSEISIQDTVHGLFMCRGDVPSVLCGNCVINATNRISSECSSFQEAIIWYSHCLLRYSYRNFFSKVNKSPMFSELNITSRPSKEQNFFTIILAKTLDQLAIETGDSDEKFGTKSAKLNDLQTLYSLAQCTQDLSGDDCRGCLGDVIGTAIPWSRLGSVGGRVLYPSCNLRFELLEFYMDGNQTQLQRPPKSIVKKRTDGRLRTIIWIAVPTIVLVLVFSFGYYLLKRKASKSYKTILEENFGHESATLEPLQFDLAVIEAATNNFSYQNRIGKGGFGEVYKGILLDGRQIAVKRLFISSTQGVNQFKNEVLLIAKLQHRNLVAFIGFCLAEHEKILICEYVPNKSLNYFLFDSQRQRLLSWYERYNIIGGIAQGILYLHEHSRLKVIHRDLKPSNVLLDENMIPKISDFGLARIVEINQDQENTNIIAGTYGYMSPEYAMLGQFSEKSDIYSFGVMVLEIITGKKNLNFYEAHRVAGGLLSDVWRHWKDETLLSLLDPNIKENYSENEVIKCIQIGLLCVQQNPGDRPTMVTVVSYLNSQFIELPTFQEPASFLHGRMDPTTIAEESSSNQFINNSMPFSINEFSASEFLPR